MGGGRAPKPDANIGIAAMKSAETGQMMLDWMKGQAEITNQWAGEDRARYKNTFLPLQDKFISDAQTYDTPERRQAEAAAAGSDVMLQGRIAADGRRRQAMAMGVNPASGRFMNAEAKAGTDVALAAAGAGNLARRNVEQTGRGLIANAINLGQGMAVNPGTSMGLSNQAGGAGFSGAMQGYGQQGQLLNQDYQNRMQAWQANQGMLGSLGGAFGSIAGLIFGSSKEIKHDKKPATGNLEKIEAMPIEEWTYNEGQGDGGRHVGPYAEDFAAATGKGDGKTINVIDAIGVTMGGLQEVSGQVRQLAAQVDKLTSMMPRGLPATDMRAAA